MIFFFFPGLSDEQSQNHRLYDFEVIELSNNVSFILMLPPAEDLCIVQGQGDDIVERDDFVLLPVQVFEMSKYTQHFSVYLYKKRYIFGTI